MREGSRVNPAALPQSNARASIYLSQALYPRKSNSSRGTAAPEDAANDV
jgi:hypothetical protein